MVFVIEIYIQIVYKLYTTFPRQLFWYSSAHSVFTFLCVNFHLHYVFLLTISDVIHGFPISRVSGNRNLQCANRPVFTCGQVEIPRQIPRGFLARRSTKLSEFRRTNSPVNLRFWSYVSHTCGRPRSVLRSRGTRKFAFTESPRNRGVGSSRIPAGNPWDCNEGEERVKEREERGRCT